MVPVAHANDGGGSIRIPASACGLVGLKPSRGRVSLAPEFGDTMTGLTAEHVVARSVRDSARILDLTQGLAAGDPYVAPTPTRPYLEEVGADPGKLRVGLTTAAPNGQFEVHPDNIAGAEAAARLLESLGVSESFDVRIISGVEGMEKPDPRLFRLALNITGTRLILLHGYAGEVINAFGNFVVGGNYAVGVVIFAILVIIQFVVITNGAGRVADELGGMQTRVGAHRRHDGRATSVRGAAQHDGLDVGVIAHGQSQFS